MNNYLLTIVLKSDLEEKDRKALLETLTKKATGEEGKITKEDLWGVRDLAYPIKRQTKGYFANFEIDTLPKSMKGIDKTLKLEEDVLRYLVVRV